jgi:hypothetical protein
VFLDAIAQRNDIFLAAGRLKAGLYVKLLLRPPRSKLATPFRL